jgi:hypothetical protein
MGALIASGESVPLSVIEGVTGAQADALIEHGINDIDALAQTSVDDLVEFLDLSLDEADVILNAAKAVIAMRDKTLAGEPENAGETIEEEPVAEAEEAAPVSTEGDTTAAGYDEAVESRAPYIAEPEILAQHSADPVALTEADPITEAELVLQEAGRDLRPDTVVPSPDITSTEEAALEHLSEFDSEVLADEFAMNEENAATAAANEESAPAVLEDAASSESTDEEKQDASPDAAN